MCALDCIINNSGGRRRKEGSFPKEEGKEVGARNDAFKNHCPKGIHETLCIWRVPSRWRVWYSQIQSLCLETEAKVLGLEAKVLGDSGDSSFSTGDVAFTTGRGTGDNAYHRKAN